MKKRYFTGAISGSANNVFIGRYPGSSVALFNGSMDDMAIWNRSLTAEEINGIYNATAGGIKMQARSCDDALCFGEDFVGSSGVGSYYTNVSYESLSNLQPNKYFQYKAFFETSDASVSPLLYNVTVKAHTQQALEDVSISKAWIDFNGSNYNMSGSGFSWSYANSTLDKGGYTYRVYVNDSFGNVNATETRTFSVPSYNITFNVTSGETGLGLNNLGITCDYIGFSQGSDTTNMYGPYTFPVGSWNCLLADIFGVYFNKTFTFSANQNKTVNVIMSKTGGLTWEEHQQLDWLYNCWRFGDCQKLLSTINETTSNIWAEYIPTNISVVANETFVSKTLSASSNITIDYTINVPYKQGVGDKALLPIRIFYWFTNASGACYSQDKQTTASNRAEYPFCIPLIAEYLGPNNGSVSFKVELKPNLPPGTYEIVRQIDIDPPINGEQVWVNYGREAIGSINILNEIVSTVLKPEETNAQGVIEAKAPSLPGMGAITGAAVSDTNNVNISLATSSLIGLAMICLTITILGMTYLRKKP